MQPRAARSLRWKLGSSAIVAGLGVLGWLYMQSSGEPVVSLPLSAAGVAQSAEADQRSLAAHEQGLRATSADHVAAGLTSNGIAALSESARGAEPCAPGSVLRAGVCAQIAAAAPSASARGAEPCAHGFALRAGVCTQIGAPPPAGTVAAPGQPLAAAAVHKAKRMVASEAKIASQLKAAVRAAVPARQASSKAANASQEPEAQDPLAGLELGGDGTARSVQPARKATTERLPLKAAEERTPVRAVQTDADPGPPSIDGELELLGAAQTALQKQRPSRALTLLQEHAFRFPTGAMVEERMAMQALALCALQRRHAAQTVLSNLEARGSQSQLLPRVRSQCGL